MAFDDNEKGGESDKACNDIFPENDRLLLQL